MTPACPARSSHTFAGGDYKMEQGCVKVRAYVEQVIDGMEYQGSISFDDHVFNYQLSFGVPIGELDEIAEEDPAQVLRQIHVAVKDDRGNAMPLDEQEEQLFITIAGGLAAEFYHDPQTRDAQDGVLPLARTAGILIGGGFSASIGMSRSYKMHRIPALEKLLQQK